MEVMRSTIVNNAYSLSPPKRLKLRPKALSVLLESMLNVSDYLLLPNKTVLYTFPYCTQVHWAFNHAVIKRRVALFDWIQEICSVFVQAEPEKNLLSKTYPFPN